MDMPALPQRAVEKAVMRLLRPLVRLLLRHAVPFAAFEALAKRVYVEAALHDFALPGKKPSISRVSILSGLTRKEVQRLLAGTDDEAEEPAARHNRAVRVLGGWARDADFHDAGGAPRPLAVDGEGGFAALVRRHSGDMPARAVLDELLRVGAVRQRADGLIEAAAHGYVPQRSTVDKLHMLGTDVADLITTIDHNLEHGSTDPRFQRKVMYRHVDPALLPAFRALSARQAQAVLEKLDRWLAEHAAGPPLPLPGAPDDPPQARAGLGIYYFEERMSPAKAEGAEQ